MTHYTKIDQLFFLEHFIEMWGLVVESDDDIAQRKMSELLTHFSKINGLPLKCAQELFLKLREQIPADEK